MTDRLAAARLWADTLKERTDERIELLQTLLADNVRNISPMGAVEGREAVVASFGGSPLAAMFAQGTWSEPAQDGEAVTISCKFPPVAPIGGLDIRITFDTGDRITRVDNVIIPAPPPQATAISLNDTIAEAVNGALLNGTPVVVGYVDGEGRPHLSLRGSVQVFAKDQLAMWIRNPQGGILSALPGNPNVALFYRDPAKRVFYQFGGRGRVDNTEATRRHVYDNTPEPERNLDPQAGGVAVIVDLDKVEGRDGSGAILMERGA